MQTPDGYRAVIATFGDPAKYRLADGTLSVGWEAQHITRVNLPDPMRYVDGGYVTRVAVHKLIAATVDATLAKVLDAGLWDELQPYGGGFEPRLKRGSSQVSLHTFGIALDFAPDRYPLGSDARMPDALVSIFEAYGFFYGGNFEHRLDPMHFQFARNC